MNINLSVIDYQEQRVLTTKQLANAYEADIKTLAKNFERNKDKYILGVDYYALEGDEKTEFLNQRQIDASSKHAKAIYLWTEMGALLHAKSLSTDKAWEVYRYLVDFYFRVKEKNVFTLPTTYVDALRKLADAVEANDALLKANQTMLPKAEAYDKFMSGVNAQTMDVVAKTLGIGRNKLFEFLRNEKVLKSGGEERNVPYQSYYNRGYFEVRQVPIQRTAGVQNKPQTLVSPKGLEFIRKLVDSKKQALVP